LGEKANLPARPRQDILGFPVSACDFLGNVELITRAALAGQGMWVLTLNMEMVARAATDSNYHALMEKVDLAVADGMPILLLSRLGITPYRITERSCGVDLACHLLRHFPGRIGILGGRNPRAALTALGLDPARLAYLNDGGVDPGALGPIIAELRASGCQLLLVALGVPKQDQVCLALHRAIPSLVCIGVGGSFEILSGARRRAPTLAQDLGLEWLYRLMLEPKRLAGRYLGLYPRGFRPMLNWIRAARAAAHAKAPPASPAPPAIAARPPILPEIPRKIALRGETFPPPGPPRR
jgi:N-acetylglucosaminyldiphosphoundecaprenol N-acetyl-beta-D-mannosaminyltransferase